MAAEEQLLKELLCGLSEEDLARLAETKAGARRLGESGTFYVEGADGWVGNSRFFQAFGQQDPLLRETIAALHQGPQHALPEWMGTEIDVVVDLDRQLKAMGIDLILSIHPFKEEIYSDRWLPTASKGDLLFPELAAVALTLLRKDVEVVYLLPRFLAASRTSESPLLFAGTRDMHWTHAGISIAARAIADRLKRYEDLRETDQDAFAFRNDGFGRVFDGEELYRTEIDSPVLIMGDSFTGAGADYFGLHAQVAKEIGFPTARLWISGGSRQMPWFLAEMGGEYLSARRAVVWNLGSALFHPLHEVPIPTVRLPIYDPEKPAPTRPDEELQLYVVVEETSEVPDPGTSLYDDALTVSTLRILNVERGSSDDRRVRGAQWVMRERTLVPEASAIAKGDHARVVARPFISYREENPGIETVQRSDETTDLDVPLYWIEEWHLIKRRVERD